MGQMIDQDIDGLEIIPLKQIKDSRGRVMHMMRADSPHFKSFGEVYFSVVNEGVVKAWKKHLQMTQHLTVPVGKIKIVISDDRSESLTKGKMKEITVGQDCYNLIKIPPGLWYGFQGISAGYALIANCTDMMFSEHEVVREDLNQSSIHYPWSE